MTLNSERMSLSAGSFRFGLRKKPHFNNMSITAILPTLVCKFYAQGLTVVVTTNGWLGRKKNRTTEATPTPISLIYQNI